VCRFDRCPGTSVAETAFLVDDRYQHQGLGHQLITHLAAAAWARGVTTFTGETLATNREMLSVFRHSGFPVTSSSSQGVVSVRFPIEPLAQSVAPDATARPASA
jgi:GNAT superfamily N-acetyltransferase